MMYGLTITRSFLVACALWVIIQPNIGQASTTEIDWKVTNRFPVFISDENQNPFAEIEKNWQADQTASDFLSQQSSNTLETLLPITKTLWNPQTGTYDRKKFFSKTHQVEFKLIQLPDSHEMCHWQLDGVIRQSSECVIPFATNIEEDTQFELTVRQGGEEIASVSDQVKTEFILAFGDSFASGEGNPDHATTFAGLPDYTSLTLDWFVRSKPEPMGHKRIKEGAAWWDRACHRSLLAWPSMFALERAIKKPHTVVRFATFACSGAEIYDGFFNQQKYPPGYFDDASTNSKHKNYIPGVEIFKTNLAAELQIQGTETLQKASFEEVPRLVKSQLDAAIDLLCEDKQSSQKTVTYKAKQSGNKNNVLADKEFYGAFKHAECIGEMKHPDIVLMSFGGNDFGFSNIVRWSILPKTARKGILRPLGNFGLKLTRKFMGAISPIQANNSIEKHLKEVYQHLNIAYKNILNIDTSKVYALQYPLPLPSSDFDKCSKRLGLGNEAFGQLLSDQRIFIFKPFNGWVLRPEVTEIRTASAYVANLRCKQQSAFDQVGWKILDADKGFEMPNNTKRTWCAVNANTEQGEDSISDRFAWVKQKINNEEDYPTIDFTSDWESYAADRTRGLRTANDAVLTQATIGDLGEQKDHVTEDWIYGVAHPTAIVHAAIASELAEKTKRSSSEAVISNNSFLIDQNEVLYFNKGEPK